MKKAVFLLGSPTVAAAREGQTITDYDFNNLTRIAERANLDAEIVFAVQHEEFVGAKKPGMVAIRAERGRVVAEIAAIAPEIVLAFGPEAVKSLWNSGTAKAKDLRRKPHKVGDVDADVFTTYSLAEASMKTGLTRWIGLDVMTAASGKYECKLGDYHVSTEMHEELIEWLKMPDEPIMTARAVMSKHRELICALDLETYPALDPWHPEARIRMAVISHRTGWAQVVPATADSRFPDWLVEIIGDPNIRKVGSNIKFDYRWLARFGVTMRNLGDTHTAEHVLDGNHPSKDLKSLTLQYHPTLGDYSADMRTMAAERGGMEHLKDEEMFDYAGGDGDASITVYNKQINLLTKRGLRQPYELLAKSQESLARIEMNGMCVDVDENRRLDKAYAEETSRLRERIQQQFDAPINPNSPKQLKEALLKLPGINLLPNNIKRRIQTQRFFDPDFMDSLDEFETTSKEVLQREVDKHPVLQDVLDYRRRAKLHSTYVTKFADSFVRQADQWFVRSDYRTDVAQTYRLASRRPNLQNIPCNLPADMAHLNIKNQFISRWRDMGGMIGEFDLSQAELREGAMITGEPVLVEAFAAGRDVHKEVSARLLKIPAEEVTKPQRKACKTLNFMIFYGGGAPRLAAALGISENEARKMIANYFSEMSTLDHWMQEMRRSVHDTLVSKSRFGFERHFVAPAAGWDNPTGWGIERQAINHPIQNGACCFTLCGINRVFELLDLSDLYSLPICTVHDQIGWDIFPGEKEAVEELTKEAFENPRVEDWGVDMSVPMVLDSKFGINWGVAV